MHLAEPWDSISFADARMLLVSWRNDRLSIWVDDVFVLPSHPSNATNDICYLSPCHLIFEQPAAISVQVYSSKTDDWHDLAMPYPLLTFVSEVIIADYTTWVLKGWSDTTDGWIEWQIRFDGDVYLDGTFLIAADAP